MTSAKTVSPHHPRRGVTLAAVTFFLAGFSSLPAQVASSPVIGRQEALALAKSGNTPGAVARIQDAVERVPGAPHEDVQLGRLMASLSYSLKSDKESARAREIADLALARLDQPQGRMTREDAVAAYLAAAELQEHVYGDIAKAKAAYEQALAIEPRATWASERLQHLKAVEQNAREKAQANQLLAQRARDQKR